MAKKVVCFLLGSGHMGKIHLQHLESQGIEVHSFDGIEDCHAFLRECKKYTQDPEASYFTLIATPASTHYEYVKSALEHGLDIFVEKPLATSLADAEELIQFAKDHQRLLFVGHCECYSNAFEKSKPFFLDICKRYPLESLSFVRYNSPTERCRDVSSVWDIGVHDYALFYELKRIAPLTDWRRVQVTFDEDRDSAYPIRMIYATFHGKDRSRPFWRLDLNPNHPITLKTHKSSIYVPEEASTDAVSNEQREFLRLLNLPQNLREKEMMQNLETALFAVQTAELYSTSPNSPK